MDWKIELVAIPVSDVDRAKAFYTEKAGFNADHDHRVSEEVRFVQLTPPGSACSIAIGTGISQSQPGSVQGMQMVVSDINAARAELLERGLRSARSRSSPGVRSFSSAIRTATAGPCSSCQLAISRLLVAGSRRRKDRQRNAHPRAARAGA
jgi:predicted enzyme related to lactoylglutathione lyase